MTVCLRSSATTRSGCATTPHKSKNERTCSPPPRVLLAQITTLENQLKKSEGAKVDQEILRTLLMKVTVLYFLIYYYILFRFYF